MDRLARILRRADELGMAPILSLAHFGIDYRYIESPDAARAAADNVIDWLTEQGLRNVLIEGQSPEQHVAMIEATRRMVGEVRGKPDAIPIVFNEAGPWWEVDQMDKWMQAFRECVKRHVSWGYFTQGTGKIKNGKRVDEPYVTGYPTPPANWGINTPEKQRFFEELRAITQG